MDFLTGDELIISILSSATVSSIFVGIIIWVSREWISAHLKGSIQHEYDQKLEAYKVQLSAKNEVAFLDLKTSLKREAALHLAAQASFSEGQKATIERKLEAIDRLWNQVVLFRRNLPPIITFIDVLLVEEYKDLQSNPTFQKLSEELTAKNIAKIVDVSGGPIEKIRPYVGEYLWALFYSYQSIILRMLLLLNLGRIDASKIEWHKDFAIRQLLEAVLTTNELLEFDNNTFGKISFIQQLLESKILLASQKIISGEEFGDKSLEQAALIQKRASQLTAKENDP